MSPETSATFLLEVGTEEIPDRMLRRGAADLRDALERALEPLGILGEAPVWGSWSTPRRLAVAVGPVRLRQADREEEVTGPPARAAFDGEGRPTKALEGFARGQGVALEDVGRVQTAKGEYMGFRRTVAGRPAAELLPAAVGTALGGLHFPKMMRWGTVGFRFVRPIRWIVALLGGEVVPLEVAGVTSGRVSRGHRTLGAGEVSITSPDSYLDELRAAGVHADPEERRASIRAGLERAAGEAGGALLEDDRLLESLVAMTERPGVIFGVFPDDYLELPREVLVTAMRHHQHYFSVVRPGSSPDDPELRPAFLAVMNQPADDGGVIRRGNEWVLRARLADARFFWEQDRKAGLESRLPDLERVIFQERLGSYRAKVDRVARLVETLGTALCLEGATVERAARAALLSKCDLTTEMVGEFPELQGVMGGIYLRAGGGEHAAVADAIYDQYRPAAAGDALPRGTEGLLLGLADRLDTLAGYFLIGAEPTGARDPFALRRAAGAVVRILAEQPWFLSLAAAVEAALEGYAGVEAGGEADPRERLATFFRDRTRRIGLAGGHRYDSVSSVLAVQSDDIHDAMLRLEALTELRREVRLEEAFVSLAVAHKRIRNLVPGDQSPAVNPARLEEPPEHELNDVLGTVESQVDELLAARDYLGALESIASLRPAVDAFLGASRDEGVLVMAPDEALRQNRLGLLRRAGDLFSRIADFSEIVVEGEGAAAAAGAG